MKLFPILAGFCLSGVHLWAQAQPDSRRLALLVGVGTFANPGIPKLSAPEHDVDHMVEVLSGFNGYGFKPEHMVVLKNERATLAAFREAFETRLIRGSRPQDIVLIYFSGHGSQQCDLDGDEQNDSMDETLVFFDSRSGEVGDLVDDELGALIDRIPAQHVVLILDACHSGSGSKGDVMTAKSLKPVDCATEPASKSIIGSTTDNHMVSPDQGHPGLVFISAVADDARLAYEREGLSNLTSWLTTVLAQSTGHSLNYEQLATRLRARLSSFGQTPAFKGALGKSVFGLKKKERPIAWMITKKSRNVFYAKGIPMPGWSQNGVVDIYDENATSEDYALSKNIKATMTITGVTGNTAILQPCRPEKASADGSREGRDKTVRVGDYVVLHRPGETLSQIKVRLRPESKPGGIPKDRAAKIATAIRQDKRLTGLVALVEQAAEFEIALDQLNHLQIIGPEGTCRNRLTARSGAFDPLIWNLWLFAMQRHFEQLKDEPHGQFEEGALSITLVFERGLVEDFTRKPFQDDHIGFHLPSGVRYQIRVSYEVGKGSQALTIGGLILSSDGSIYGFPYDGNYPVLKPGESYTFPQTFEAMPPFGLDDRILVFGTKPQNTLFWNRFQYSANDDASGKRNRREYQYLLDFLTDNRRSDRLIGKVGDPWIITYLTHRVFE